MRLRNRGGALNCFRNVGEGIGRRVVVYQAVDVTGRERGIVRIYGKSALCESPETNPVLL